MMYHSLVLCLVAFAVSCQGQMEPTENYSHSAALKSGNIFLYWKFDEIYITFEVIGQTTGWIGIGFSPNGAMTASDIIVGWVKNGVPTVTDRHGDTSNTFPPIDPEKNINVLGGSESNGWTMFKFSRQIAACEAEYDREITSNTEKLIWAYGDTDPTGEDLAPGDYHGTKRGAESMYFLQSSGAPSELPDGPVYNNFDVLASNFTIPDEDTYYNCKLYKMPDFGGKKHVVKWEPIIQQGNELHVHHMLVYRCGDILENEEELEKDARCYSSNMAHFSSCSTILVEWAIGAEAMIYPEIAGLPIGGPDDPVYIQLETHYDNPFLKSGVRDSSGIRFTYTSTLREQEIGILQVGMTVNGLEHLIPPRAENFRSIGHCTSDCFGNRMNASGYDNVTAFSVVLHSHLAGRKLRLRHIRNGVELPYIGRDENYDFNYQEARYLSPGVTLTNKDNFQMECDYNTQDRSVVTEGGLGTMQEMCMAFIYYYPKIDLGFCISSVYFVLPWGYLGIDATNVQKIDNTAGDRLAHYNLSAPANVAGKTVFEYMNELNWTDESIKDFENYYNSASHYGVCVPKNVSKTTANLIDPINITTPYIAPVKACEVSQTPQTVTTTSHGSTWKPSAFMCLLLSALSYFAF